jgi:hypothetical protein
MGEAVEDLESRTRETLIFSHDVVRLRIYSVMHA